MLNADHYTVLSTLLRESGSEAILMADKLIDMPPPERPVQVGQAIATFGRSSDTVRVLARGCNIADWLGEEVKARSSAPAPMAP